MGNQPGKLQQTQNGRPKKMVHWKTAEPPSPPGRPILIPLSDQQPDAVNLRWERPKLDGGSPITGYIVEHRRMGSPHWVRATPTPVPNCEVSVGGLEPGWRYQFRAFAENVVGRSEPSELSDALTVTLQRNAITVPRFLEELQDMQAVEDERIEFRVSALGQPPPEINWFKDGYEIFSSRRTKIVNENDFSVLIIHQVALTDEGEIKCTATNRAGIVVTKATLLVQAPPKIRMPRTYEDGLIVEAGEVLRLKVGIAGQPSPAVTWFHEGDLLQLGDRFEVIQSERNSLLKIDSVQRQDRGEYSIKAANRLGQDMASFLVTVTARPMPPGRVRLNMSFGKSATLSWTAPVDDGGCKIGNYIVEYFRIGWNVWLKAATTRLLSTTLNDLIEGSEYKFRVKAENPYGVSDPSEESDVLFIPDPKRGIVKPKSESKLSELKTKPTPARRKALSPPAVLRDASTETRVSPRVQRKHNPELLDSEVLHREMSYGTPDQVLKNDVRKSPSISSADSAIKNKSNTSLKLDAPATTTDKSPQRSPKSGAKKLFTPFLQPLRSSFKDRTPSPTAAAAATNKTADISKTPSKPQETIQTFSKTETNPKRITNSANVLPERRNSSPLKTPPKHEKPHTAETLIKSNTVGEISKTTAALARSAEPVQLGFNQNVRRFSGQLLNSAKNGPSLAIAIATSALGQDNNKPLTITTPTIQISAPPTPDIITPTAATTPLTPIDKHDDVHTSNEFMLVVFDKNSKVKDKDKQDSFELELEDAIQPPPISISAPDLASLEFTNLHTFPLRRSVSSTELLYERAMARFYEAVELEEAEKNRKRKSQERTSATTTTTTTNTTTTNVQPTTIRKRLGSMTESERLSFEKRSELRRQSTDLQDLKNARKWSSREDISHLKPLSRDLLKHHFESQESEELSDGAQALVTTNSFDIGTDYTESTASSEKDSIEQFKLKLMERTRSPSPPELETYHPRNMSAGIFTPYRTPTQEQSAVVLNRPMPLPSPDFVPKPILKRTSNDNDDNVIGNANNNGNTNSNPNNEKRDLTKGIKSFFSRDKRSTTEKNTEENQIISNPNEKENALAIALDVETKRKAKEEEEQRRKEAERIMMEEAHAAADHYGDLVRQVSTTKKYHKPIYMDKDELKKVADKAALESLTDDDADLSKKLEKRRSQSPIGGLMPPISNKPRLSISERGQLIHVRETASDLAVSNVSKPLVPDTPSEDSSNAPQFPTTDVTSTIVSETIEERPDSRGRKRIVKVKRIVKRRVPSSTRSRDASLSRPPSSLAASTTPNTINIDLPQIYINQNERIKADIVMPTITKEISNQLIEIKSAEQLSEEAHEKVRSAFSYSTDLILFIVACYVYLFKDARLVLPILALMIYRQLGEAISARIPKWMKRKKE